MWTLSSNVEKIVGTQEEIDNKINEVKDQAEKLKKENAEIGSWTAIECN